MTAGAQYVYRNRESGEISELPNMTPEHCPQWLEPLLVVPVPQPPRAAAEIRKAEAENKRLRHYLDQRASGTDPLTTKLREDLDAAQNNIAVAIAESNRVAGEQIASSYYALLAAVRQFEIVYRAKTAAIADPDLLGKVERLGALDKAVRECDAGAEALLAMIAGLPLAASPQAGREGESNG